MGRGLSPAPEEQEGRSSPHEGSPRQDGAQADPWEGRYQAPFSTPASQVPLTGGSYPLPLLPASSPHPRMGSLGTAPGLSLMSPSSPPLGLGSEGDPWAQLYSWVFIWQNLMEASMEPQTLATAGGGCGEQTGPGYPTWGAWKAELPLQPTPRCSRRPSGLLEELGEVGCRLRRASQGWWNRPTHTHIHTYPHMSHLPQLWSVTTLASVSISESGPKPSPCWTGGSHLWLHGGRVPRSRVVRRGGEGHLISESKTGPRSLGNERLESPAESPAPRPLPWALCVPPASRPMTQHPRPAQKDFCSLPAPAASRSYPSRVFQQHLPSMQKVGAPGDQGQAPSGMGALGRSGVMLLTYVLAALELTCLFMQFSIMPVSTLPQAACPIPLAFLPAPAGPTVQPDAARLLSLGPLAVLELSQLRHTGTVPPGPPSASPGLCCSRPSSRPWPSSPTSLTPAQLTS